MCFVQFLSRANVLVDSVFNFCYAMLKVLEVKLNVCKLRKSFSKWSIFATISAEWIVATRKYVQNEMSFCYYLLWVEYVRCLSSFYLQLEINDKTEHMRVLFCRRNRRWRRWLLLHVDVRLFRRCVCVCFVRFTFNLISKAKTKNSFFLLPGRTSRTNGKC